jgi:hypothetical protein
MPRTCHIRPFHARGHQKAKTEGFDLREGEEYKIRLKITVEGNKISGLYQTQEVFREGLRHSWDTKMLVSMLPKVVSFRREAYFKKRAHSDHWIHPMWSTHSVDAEPNCPKAVYRCFSLANYVLFTVQSKDGKRLLLTPLSWIIYCTN